MLAGAIAYYALLSLVPISILLLVVLSHWIDPQALLDTMGRYLEWLVPSQSQALIADVSGFFDQQVKISAVLILTMIFFSSFAFSVLEKAMAVIFARHHRERQRHFLTSALLPYCFIIFLGLIMVAMTFGTLILQTMDQTSIHAFHRDWSLEGLSGFLFYVVGLLVKVGILATLYLVLPVDGIRVRHALVGGLTAALLWEAIHYMLLWYLTTLSKTSVVYGSLTTAVVALFTMEIAATLLLLGAQVIAEYERLGDELAKGQAANQYESAI